MSANGAIITTLDFSFFGGGYLEVTGEATGSLPMIFGSSAVVPITGEIQPVTLDFIFQAGIETPTVYGEANLSISFDSYGFIEFGVQRFGEVGQANQAILFEYTANSAGYVTTHGYFDNTLNFNLDTNIFVFSLGETSGFINGWGVNSTALNISTREYSEDGINIVDIDKIEFNDALVLVDSNYVEINPNGITYAEIK
jgi:hypothetical protein